MRTLVFIQQGSRLCSLALGVSLALPTMGGTDLLSPLSSLQQSASADDWCQFRGPTGDGISQATNVPVRWSTNHNVKWRSAVPGVGRSSPVLLGRRVWLTTALTSNVRTFAAGPDRMQQAERVEIGVVCLDRTNGEQLYYRSCLPWTIHRR